jgi:O-antigen ligase
MPPNTLEGLFYESRNNVLDAAKSGGLFVNANIAAAYLGVSAVAAWYVAKSTRSTSLRGVAVLNWCAVFFTGSKAGLLCALVLPTALALSNAIRVRRINPLAPFAALIALGGAAGVAVLGEQLFADFSSNAISTLVSREEIWRYAIGLIEEHPIVGLGFGGWEERFTLYSSLTGGTTTVPAHNSLFILWLQSGLPGLLCGVIFVATVYSAVVRCFGAADVALVSYAMGVAGAFTWYFVQGLGENFGLVGEVHMTPLLGVLLGHLCARYDAVMVKHELSEPVRGSAAPSTVPAV